MNTHPSLGKSDKENDKIVEESCCGGSATSREDACCLADEKAKNQGDKGCGCECSGSTNNA